jgi:hypothetical protein
MAAAWMVDHDFNSAIVDQVVHRPWQMPQSPWLMTQTWHDLLFAHWPVRPSALRGKVPEIFELDLFQGEAWVGMLPFHMTNVAPRGVPALPWVSEFPELNVRTYVRVGDRPGIYFFSLDAGSRVAVETARAFLNLPYHAATMSVAPAAHGIEYRSSRDSDAAEFHGIYGPTGSVFVAEEGSLEYFLTERYCFYNLDHRGVPYRLQIHHPPWRLQTAAADVARNTMADVNGLRLDPAAPVFHYANRQDMVAWAPERLDA